MELTEQQVRKMLPQIQEQLALPDDQRFLDINNWRFEMRKRRIDQPRTCEGNYMMICKVPGYDKLTRSIPIDRKDVEEFGGLENRLRFIRANHARNLAALQHHYTQRKAVSNLRDAGIIFPKMRASLPNHAHTMTIAGRDLMRGDHLS